MFNEKLFVSEELVVKMPIVRLWTTELSAHVLQTSLVMIFFNFSCFLLKKTIPVSLVELDTITHWIDVNPLFFAGDPYTRCYTECTRHGDCASNKVRDGLFDASNWSVVSNQSLVSVEKGLIPWLGMCQTKV